jgi:branched-chain amino acid transport system ATP-binding protein
MLAEAVEARPGAAKPDPLLVADGVKRRFGGLLAVDVAHLEVQRGAITALIGPNGAGKTTFFNVLCGFDRPDAGSWTFRGERANGVPSHRLAGLGMVRTFQLTKVLSKLSVLDNMMLAAPRQDGERLAFSVMRGRWRERERVVEQQALTLLERFRLLGRKDDYAGTLSGGQRKLLEMARALMAEPEMILLDEPMAGVNPALVESLLDHIRGLREMGVTVLFVEHDMDVVMGISDWVVCMAVGQVIAEGTPKAVAADPRVIDAYLGASHGETAVGDGAGGRADGDGRG